MDIVQKWEIMHSDYMMDNLIKNCEDLGTLQEIKIIFEENPPVTKWLEKKLENKMELLEQKQKNRNKNE